MKSVYLFLITKSLPFEVFIGFLTNKRVSIFFPVESPFMKLKFFINFAYFQLTSLDKEGTPLRKIYLDKGDLIYFF